MTTDARTILGRRELLIAAGAVTSATVGGSAWAAGYAAHGDRKSVQALLDALSHCTREGERCLTHCLASFAEGNASLADCAMKVRDMLAVCSAMSTLSAAHSPRRQAMAGVCVAACEDCAAACREHAEMHARCRDCMAACEAVIPLLQALSA